MALCWPGKGKKQWEGGLQGQHKGSGGSRALSSHRAPLGGWVDGWVGDHRMLLPSGPDWF